MLSYNAGVRPVPLGIHIQGIDLANMEARMQAMARPAYAAICNHTGESKPALLFVPTRKHARSTALDMLTFAAAEGKPQRFLQVSPAQATLLCRIGISGQTGSSFSGIDQAYFSRVGADMLKS